MIAELATHPAGTYLTYMTHGMEDAVRRALEVAPGSMRALAHEAGVSEGLLRHIRDGRRTATPRTVEALAAALERLRDRHGEAAEVLRDTLTEQGGES